MIKLVLTQSVLTKTTRWLTIGFAASLVAIAGCSSPNSTSNATSDDTASTEPTTETAQQPTDANETKPEAAGKTEFRVVENVTLQPGTDPMAMVFAARQPSTDLTGAEQIKLNYPSAEKAVVLVTKTGLADDSVAATRMRYEFAPVDTAEGTRQWQLTQVTEQNKCQPNRGAQDWTGDLCQ